MQNSFHLCLTRDVKVPQRAHPTDAGIDFFVPNTLRRGDHGVCGFPETCIRLGFDENDVLTHIDLYPGASVLIPLGVKVKVPDGHAMIFFNKSGVAAKRSLVLGSCLVDQDYQGEVLLNLHNASQTIQRIVPGEKIAQGVLLKINFAMPEQVSTVSELYPEKSERGEGGFGSTN